MLLAAGRGTRVGGATPKQYRSLNGVAVVRRTALAFLDLPEITSVRVVIDPAHRALYDDAVRGLGLAAPIDGGATRSASAWRGLEALADAPPDAVLIHDAARPFVDAALIRRVLEALRHGPAAAPGLALTDALVRCDDSGVLAPPLDRKGLHALQTPQAFAYPVALAAHRAAADREGPDNWPDDAAVLTAAGVAVRLVPGAAANRKLTIEADFAAARTPLTTADIALPRCGSGFDAHRFGPGDAVTLCGVRIPHSHGLIGHSDADVALHALTNAVLGAIGGGDIGAHFQASDPQWRDAPSRTFVEWSRDSARAAGARLINADLTLVCQRPALAPYRRAMTAAVATMLALPLSRVNIKATTTEGMGFTGRGEGVAALASVMALL